MGRERMKSPRPMAPWRKDLGLVLPSVALLLIALPLLLIATSLQRKHEEMTETSTRVIERYREWARDIRAERPEPDRSRLVAALQIEASLRGDSDQQYRTLLEMNQALALFVGLLATLQIARVHRPFRRWRKRRRARTAAAAREAESVAAARGA